VPSTPSRLRGARACYDHRAGTVAVALHDRLKALGWPSAISKSSDAYDLTADGASGGLMSAERLAPPC